MIRWEPLGIDPRATPEEAFIKAAAVANESEAVLICWSKSNGWGGVRAVAVGIGEPRPAPAQPLAVVDDCHVVAIHPKNFIHVPEA